MRPVDAVQQVGQFLHPHIRDGAVGIHFPDRRNVGEIAARRGELRQIGAFIPWVGVEILPRGELSRIHENARDDSRGFFFCLFNEGQMSAMQCPHCGDKSHAFASPLPGRNLLQ